MFKLRKLGKVYHYDICLCGKRYRGSTKANNKDLAKIVTKKIYDDIYLNEFVAKKGVSGRLLIEAECPDKGWVLSRWNYLNYKEKQAILFVAHRGRCSYCGVEVKIPINKERNQPDRATLDHSIPIASGGSDAFDNMVLSCNKCNQEKSDMDRSLFVSNTTKYSTEREAACVSSV